MLKKISKFTIIFLLGIIFTINMFANIQTTTAKIILPFIKKQQITAISVGIVINKKTYYFKHGNRVLYPINSMTKSFTALLLAYYNQIGLLQLTDKIGMLYPPLQKTAIGQATLLNLATHTSGLPLPVPDNITNKKELIKYLQQWQPPYPIGTHRIYSNIGIGLIGYILENKTHKSYAQMLNKIILQPYGITHTYVNPKNIINLPKDSIYIAADGIASTAKDMATFIQLMMLIKPSTILMQQAIKTTLTGYYQTPYFTQGLSWQEYNWPISQQHFLRSDSTGLLNLPATSIQHQVNFHKKLIIRTGMGNNSSSIMAFIPQEKIGIVILIDKAIATKARLKLAYSLLSNIEHDIQHG